MTNFTKVRHAALALQARMGQAESRVYSVLMRFTWGWERGERTEADISIADYCRMTMQSKNTVKKAIVILTSDRLMERVNPESIKSARWRILEPDLSKMDGSKFDPSVLRGIKTGQILTHETGATGQNLTHKTDGMGQNSTPHPPRIKDINKDILKDSKNENEIFKTWKDIPKKYHPIFEAFITGGLREPKEKRISLWIQDIDEELPADIRPEEIITQVSIGLSKGWHIIRPKSIANMVHDARNHAKHAKKKAAANPQDDEVSEQLKSKWQTNYKRI